MKKSTDLVILKKGNSQALIMKLAYGALRASGW